MPFLAAAVPAILGGAASAGVGVAANAALNGQGGQKGSGFQAPGLDVTQSGGSMSTPTYSGALTPAQQAQLAAMSPQDAYKAQQTMQQQNLIANSTPHGQLVMPTTGAQVQQAEGQTQAGLQNSANFVAGLQGQNGIQNQSDVFSQQQSLANQLAGANAVGGQEQLAAQLQSQAQGGGPNPAQAMLAQATGANTANQAALMASQRGASSNVGLLGRQAAMQGAANQQNAVGQGASMQAQQSLAAQNQLQNLYGTQLGAQQQQQNLLGNTASTQVNQLAGANQAFNSAAQGNQAQLINALQGQNQNLLSQQATQTGANAQIANTNAQAQNNLTSGIIGGAAQGIGGAIATGLGGPASGASNLPSVQTGSTASGNPMTPQGVMQGPVSAPGATSSNTGVTFAQGGEVENPKMAAVSQGNRFPSHVMLPPHLQEVATLYHGNKFGDVGQVPHFWNGGQAQSMKQGGKVPGKAPMKGDHPENDTVKAKLSPGEVVIPKSVMESSDPVAGAAQFVAAIQKKKGAAGNPQSDFKSALQRAMKERKNK